MILIASISAQLRDPDISPLRLYSSRIHLTCGVHLCSEALDEALHEQNDSMLR
jgi:hypothetical protein